MRMYVYTVQIPKYYLMQFLSVYKYDLANFWNDWADFDETFTSR